jgi:hypothetical protein
LVHQLVGLLVGWLVCLLVGWLVGRLFGWSVGQLVGWLVGWSVGGSFGCLVGWSVGRLVRWSVDADFLTESRGNRNCKKRMPAEKQYNIIGSLRRDRETMVSLRLVRTAVHLEACPNTSPFTTDLLTTHKILIMIAVK